MKLNSIVLKTALIGYFAIHKCKLGLFKSKIPNNEELFFNKIISSCFVHVCLDEIAN